MRTAFGHGFRDWLGEDVYDSEPDQFSRFADIRKSMALQEPEYVRRRNAFVREMMARGLGRDEAEKRADAIFGPELKGRRTP